ncbi:M14 family metallopeptidase [Belliella sp. DSM 111904]|uniref:M14 family metallopeptidase n=1 Tax=Belliella filtrata TaxID=2923435 RepID=A0ABS9UUG2_9BACT|nr:M14 metallopeptidase family protein [Belliella filtrata]MCH7407810.1 M14 family metallopeptidase [Belliella filtrata]
MNKTLTSRYLLLLFLVSSCQTENVNKAPVDLNAYHEAYDNFKETSINKRRFKYDEVIHLVNDRKGTFETIEIGKSVQNRPVYQMTTGKGSTKVMLWSQMHGNESTATMALFDLMNFLEGSADDFDNIRNKILQNLQIRIIPMVNPDGMDLWTRRNALSIDLNRDAIALTSPEAKILKEARESFEPTFGFNLHDQQTYYNVSQTNKPATISVLAPAFNYETEVNDVRKKAMQVIIGMNEALQLSIPGQVGKYDDAFEPRAFGDNFQKWGTSTILIESGGYPNDPEKQQIRKLNFIAMLHALVLIADDAYQQYKIKDYYAIPDNDLKLMDVLIKNITLENDGLPYQADLGIKRREVEANGDYFVNGTIDDLGDLSVFFGYEEIDAAGMKVVEGKLFPNTFEDIDSINEERIIELLRAGYFAVSVNQVPTESMLHKLPVQILYQKSELSSSLELGSGANFFLQKDDELKYAVINGYLINLENSIKSDFKMRIY